MKNIIKVNLDAEGNAHICLYGKEVIIAKTDFGSDGRAKFRLFGEEYVAELARPIRKRVAEAMRSAKKTDTVAEDTVANATNEEE